MSIEDLRQKNSIDRQFEKPLVITHESDKLSVHFIANEHPTEENFVFFAPAYAMTVREMYKDHALQAIHAEGRNIFTFDPPPTGWDVSLSPEEEEKLKNYSIPPEEIRMAKILVSTLENPDVREKIGSKKIDVAAHSRGLGYTTIAALLRPDLFRTIGAYGGVGLIGKDNVPSLLWRTMIGQKHWFDPVDWGAEPTDLRALAEEKATEQKRTGRNMFVRPFIRASEDEIRATYTKLKAKKDAAVNRGIEEYAAPTKEQAKVMGDVARSSGKALFKYLWTKGALGGLLPNIRRIREIGGMAEIQIHEALIKLSKDLGVGVVLAYGDSDPMFQKHRHEEYTMSPEFKDANILLVSTGGTHGSLGERPVLMRVLMGAITLMNNTRQTQEPSSQNSGQH